MCPEAGERGSRSFLPAQSCRTLPSEDRSGSNIGSRVYPYAGLP